MKFGSRKPATRFGGVGTYLDRILAAHRATAAQNASQGEARPGPAVRGFARRLTADNAEGELAVIAEVKRRSPSKGDLDASLDPVAVARAFEAGGAPRPPPPH